MHTLTSLGSQLPVVGFLCLTERVQEAGVLILKPQWYDTVGYEISIAMEHVIQSCWRLWWLESLRVESVGGFSSVGVFWSILPQEPFNSEGDGLVCDNKLCLWYWVKAVPTGCTSIPTLPLPLPLNSNAASTGPESPDMNTSWTWETKDTAVVEGGSAAQSERLNRLGVSYTRHF